jgi:replication fork protection complex subunit Tof1/Swi1
VEDSRFPADVQVKKGYTWSEQLGIAIAALVEGGEGGLIDWVKDVGFCCCAIVLGADFGRG